MNRIQKVLGSAAVASLLLVAPLAASADTLHASSSTGVSIGENGIVRVIGADVTAVGNGFVDAITHFGNVVLNWVVNASAATKVAAGGSKDATTTDISVGDKIGFAGTLSSSVGSTLTVAATKIRDLTTFPLRHIGAGTISSIDSTNGSFVLMNENRTVTVQTNGSTSVYLNGATTTFAALTVGEKVAVVGTPNADGSVITASSVVIKNSIDQGEGKNDNDNDDHGDKASVGANANANADVHADGKHDGLNFLGGFGLHFGKDN